MGLFASKIPAVTAVVLSVYVCLFFTLGTQTAITGYAESPSGQWAYLLSKWLGICALCLLIAQFLSLIAGALSKGKRTLLAGSSTHKLLGVILLITVLAHVALFVLGSGLRQQQINFQILLPDFSSGHYRSMVSLGSVALVSLIFVVFSGIITARTSLHLKQSPARKSLRRGYGRHCHRLGSLVLIVATIYHSFSIGSETRSVVALLVLVILVLIVTFCLVRTHTKAPRS